MLVRVNVDHSIDPAAVKELKVITRGDGVAMLVVTYHGMDEPATFIKFGKNRLAYGRAQAAMMRLTDASQEVCK